MRPRSASPLQLRLPQSSFHQTSATMLLETPPGCLGPAPRAPKTPEERCRGRMDASRGAWSCSSCTHTPLLSLPLGRIGPRNSWALWKTRRKSGAERLCWAAKHQQLLSISYTGCINTDFFIFFPVFIVMSCCRGLWASFAWFVAQMLFISRVPLGSRSRRGNFPLGQQLPEAEGRSHPSPSWRGTTRVSPNTRPSENPKSAFWASAQRQVLVSLTQRLPDPADASCVGYVLYRIININVTIPQELCSCSWLSTQPPMSNRSPGFTSLERLGARMDTPSEDGDHDAPNLRAARRGVLVPRDQKPPHPSLWPWGKLDQPAAHAGHLLCQRASGPGCLWPLFRLPGGDFLPVIGHQAPWPGGCCSPCSDNHRDALKALQALLLAARYSNSPGLPIVVPTNWCFSSGIAARDDPRCSAAFAPGAACKLGGFAAGQAAPGSIALPDVAARCANPPRRPFSCSGAGFWLHGDGKLREEVGKPTGVRGRLRFLPRKPAR